MAKDMIWLRSTGRFFLHEMMHTRIASGSVEPHIIDGYVAPIPGGENHDTNVLRAYGPKLVHLLATRGLNHGGVLEHRQTLTASQCWLMLPGDFENQGNNDAVQANVLF